MTDTISLRELTTLQVGGPAAAFVECTSEAELIDAVLDVWNTDQPWLLLGGGSNLLVGDEPLEATVIRAANRGIERLDAPAGRVRLRVQAGEDWEALVAYTVEHGFAGIEALSGIPGSCGAAPVQNIGAYGQEIVSSLVAVDLLDEESQTVERVPAAELGLGYRTSVLKRHGGGEPERSGVVVAIIIELDDVGVDGLAAPIAYQQLAFALGVEVGEQVRLAQVRTTVLALRASKGMVLDPDDPDTASAGSFFTNPIVSEHIARSLPGDAPWWPVDPPADDDTEYVFPLGEVVNPPRPALVERLAKLSAAWLIERAGVRRGFALPGSHAAVSTKHTLALTNRGGATATEIAELARFVQARVHAEFGVLLQPEPVVVGVTI
ncbi:UDP-N-acetylmuramate dehydrogenase [Plantibacter sp. LMC-P-059a]|uniref:UDP-N-acetylmuramate dehydrogenase n=1 Tax=Plantibacter sp. LMC-P-059a TaxID=3040297 RepID=UPI0025505856|nr:UDP-N-acetylmuramate dehydrogenase [Plantibacter sp. LMC-P-059a]